MPLKPNISGMIWSYFRNKLRYPFSFKKRVTELSEPNIAYGLTDHPIDENNAPLGGLLNIHKKLFGKTSYSIDEISLKNIDNNIFDFKCIGYNIFLKKKIPEGAQEMYPVPQFKSKPQELYIRIHFLQPGIYRLLCTFNENIPKHHTAMIDKDITDTTFKAGFQEDEVKYTIQSSKIQLELYKKDFRIKIYDSDKNLVTESSGYSKNKFPSSTDSFPLGFVKIRKNKRLYGVESFVLYPGECIYGFGEQFSSLNKVGQTIHLWNWEGYGNCTGRTYKNIPFFMSTKGYGVFFNESRPITFWVGSREYNKNFVAIEGDLVDYYFFYGPELKEVLYNYTELTGKSPVPPKWSFGAWMSRISYKSQDEVLQVARRLRKEQYPFDVICIDTEWFTNDWHCDWKFDKDRFPDPEGMCKELKELGFKLSLWQTPYIMKDLPEYKEAKRLKIVAENNGPFIFLTNPSVALDFSNPKAVEWYKNKLKKLFEIGADVIKVDFGEQIENHMIFQKYDGREMHNLYSMLYQKAAFNAAKEYFGKGIIWARSGYAGSQKYPVHWSGDSSCSYEEILNVLRGGLSLGLCGFSYWSEDVGGFMFSPTDRLFLKWIQFGIFNSHMRFHGNPPRFREPWNYEVTSKIRWFLEFRYQLIPYIYTEAHFCSENGLPMLKPLVLEYQDDPTVYNIEDQFLFGRNLMITPLLTASDKRKVYIPNNEWYNYQSFEIPTGSWIDYECNVNNLPLFLRAGSIVPLGPCIQNITGQELDSLSLLVLPDKNMNIESYEIVDSDNKIKISANIQNNELHLTISKHIEKLEINTPSNLNINDIFVNNIKCEKKTQGSKFISTLPKSRK